MHELNITDLQESLGKVNECSANGEIPEELVDKILEEMKLLKDLDLQKGHKTLTLNLDQCAINLWNAAVAKKTAGNLSLEYNAKLRHTACNLLYLFTNTSQQASVLKRQTVMALKTARAWLDASQPDMSENPLSMATDCIEKRLTCLLTMSEKETDHASSEKYNNLKTELDKDQFKTLCYKAEMLCNQDKCDESFQVITQACEMIERLPSEGSYLSLLCYNFGVECFKKSNFASSVRWLKESFELGKGNSDVGCKNQARTLRLLAHAYLDWDSTLHWQKALNSVGLANAEYSHPAGLYLKMKILLQGKENDDRLNSGLEDVLRHPETTVDLGLNTINLLSQNDRHSLACEGLKLLAQKFENTPHLGKIIVAHIDALIQSKQFESVKAKIEEIITDDHSTNHLDMNTRRRVHLMIWDQAAVLFEKNDYSNALQWYNYSLSLFSNTTVKDSNLGKLHRNRATCFLQLNKMEEAEEAVAKAEICDSQCPQTYYLKYKISLLNEKDNEAMVALQKMTSCTDSQIPREENVMDVDDDCQKASVVSTNIVHELICLAAQLAFDRNNSKIAITALESLIIHSPDSQQILTSLRCIIRLKLTVMETSSDISINETSKIADHIKMAYEKLVCICGHSSENSTTVQNEASWFMKIAWNMGLKSEKNYEHMQKFFVLCNQLQLLCTVDSAALIRSKKCLLMAAAANLQIAKSSCSETDKQKALEKTLTYVDECRQVMQKMDQMQFAEKGTQNEDNPTIVLLLLYEFEAKAFMGEANLEEVLEQALDMPQCDAKVFETIAALALETKLDQHILSKKALNLAIKKRLEEDPVDYEACSYSFHSLIEQTLQNGSNTDPSVRTEIWCYFQEIVDIVENKAKGQYPEAELLWLMTKSWNCGIHLFSVNKFMDALPWCELAMKLLKYIGHHKPNYEKKMSNLYSEVLAKADESRSGCGGL